MLSHLRPIWTTWGRLGMRSLCVMVGALLSACSLQLFIIPNHITDGGILGVSILLNFLLRFPLGLLLLVLNIPFFIYGYRQIGKTFTILTLLGVGTLAGGTIFFAHMKPFTQELLLAAIFGGILLGIGSGLVIRYGGSLDGVDILAITMTRYLPFSVGQIVMFINIFILSAAGFLFGWDRAMYSLIAYYISFKVIDLVIEGLDETKSVWIISDYSEQIAQSILHRLGRGVTYLYGEGGYTGDAKRVLFCIITRLEQAKLKTIVEEIDEEAFLAIGSLHDVRGGRFKKRAIHP